MARGYLPVCTWVLNRLSMQCSCSSLVFIDLYMFSTLEPRANSYDSPNAVVLLEMNHVCHANLYHIFIFNPVFELIVSSPIHDLYAMQQYQSLVIQFCFPRIRYPLEYSFGKIL
jgi:hypothetical protein